MCMVVVGVKIQNFETAAVKVMDFIKKEYVYAVFVYELYKLKAPPSDAPTDPKANTGIRHN